METGFTLKFLNDHIHITHPPGFVFSPASIGEVWGLVERACKQYDCRRVLIEAREFKRDLDTATAFDSGIAASRIVPGLKVALCFPGYRPDDVSAFFKTVALNRGTLIEFFEDADEAREWLSLDDDEPAAHIC